LIAAVLRNTNDPPYPIYEQELRYAIYKDGAFEKSSSYAKALEGISDIAMAMGPDNKSTTIWQQRQPDGSQAVIARRPGSTTPRTIFSAPNGYGLALATAPDGGAVALWGLEDGANSLYASTYE
jgi:hypothetical protein